MTVPDRIAATLLLTPICLTQVGCQHLTTAPDRDPPPLMVTVVEEFKLDEPGEAWTFRTPERWRIGVGGDRRFLQMVEPPPRAMLPGVSPASGVRPLCQAPVPIVVNLSCRLRVDCDPSVVGRDACIIFGRRDDTHFYYVHLSNVADQFHNAIIRVDGETRTSLLPAGTHPPLTVPDTEWHKVDVIRDVDAGTIVVYVDAYDRQAKPWAQIEDRTYDWGTIGLGSFNDRASFAHLLIEGEVRGAGP